jgi:hypothetical protein
VCGMRGIYKVGGRNLKFIDFFGAVTVKMASF